MSADPAPRLPERVNLGAPAAVKQWCEHFGITEQQLAEAVKAAGDKSAAVKEQLLNQGGSAGAG